MTFHNIRSFSVWYLALCPAAFVLLSGCNKKAGFYEVSGTIQLNGKVVPMGMIVFSPDRPKGNSGPQGLAEIFQGRITRTRRPVVGGPHWLEIHAFDGVAFEEEEGTVKTGKRLIPPQKAQVDLPRSDAELTIDVQGPTEKGFTVDVKVQGD